MSVQRTKPLRLASLLAVTLTVFSSTVLSQQLELSKQEFQITKPDIPLCGPEVKQKFAEVLDQMGYHKNPLAEEFIQLKNQLFEEFSYCNENDWPGGSHNDEENRAGFCGDLSFVANTAYERMRCCGYDPQKKQFACPIEITLPYGFGAAFFPGSYEYVLTCVDFGAGFVPVARDRVHLADEIYGVSPDWHFAVIADARDQMQAIPLLGQTLVARSLLSWNTMPTDCYDNKIVWGNAIDYQIRLDP